MADHMISSAAAGEPKPRVLALWCGWVLVGAGALAPLLAWLSPLGFAPLGGLIGLLCAPAMRVYWARDRALIIVCLLGATWVGASCLWAAPQSRPQAVSVALQLVGWAVLSYCALCGARVASARLVERARFALLCGLAILGAILIIETLSDAAIYRTLHTAFYEPIRIDFARRNVAQSTFVVAVMTPLGALGRRSKFLRGALVALALSGAIAAAVVFSADAPLVGLSLGAAVALMTWRAPNWTPQLVGYSSALVFFAMPAAILLLQAGGGMRALQQHAPPSWLARLVIWTHAVTYIEARPLVGWGVGSTRQMGPAMGLHPHNAALQIWVELGLVGAALAAAGWTCLWRRLRSRRASSSQLAISLSGCVYLTYQLISFGAWQAWFVGLGVTCAVFAVAGRLAALLPD